MALKKRNKVILLIGIVVVMTAAILFVVKARGDSLGISDDTLKRLEWSGEFILVIKPKFTEAAYSENGFYSYYNGTCGNECLSIPLRDGSEYRWGSYNHRTVQLFEMLHYPTMDDSEVHLQLLKDPHFLDKYDAIILLHSEYVTKELYQAIISHKKVIYLAPNALYAEVTYQPELLPTVTYDPYTGASHVGNTVQWMMTLVKGHGYPEKSISNGFAWKYDNSQFEYDQDCNSWGFVHIPNGYQLNCAPPMSNPKKIDIILYVKEVLLK